MTTNYVTGQKDTRPWGEWEVLDTADKYIVKRIRVLPQKKLSLQMHHHRSEHWIIAQGTATVTLDDRTFEAPMGTHIFIETEQKHRLENASNEPVVFIEVQAGDTLSEDDIVRFEDAYGRV